MQTELSRALSHVRASRGFREAECVSGKVTLINDYFRRFKLTTAIVGVSGGIDSSAVLALLHRCKEEPGSPISRIFAVSLPFLECDGATGQDEGGRRAREAAELFATDFLERDLQQVHQLVKGTLDELFGIEGNPWASGQLVSLLRSPALYYGANLSFSVLQGAVVVGTANRDEASFLGWVGKTSDLAVDIQPIGDLHNSEVHRMATYLGVPQSILDAPKSGGVYDGRTTEEMIGVPLDFIELFTHYLCLDREQQHNFLNGWSVEAKEEFKMYGKVLMTLHEHNLHKYLGDTPGVFPADIYPRAVPGGWRSYTPDLPVPVKPHPSPFVGDFQLSDATIAKLRATELGTVSSTPVGDLGESAILVRDLLSPDEATCLVAEVENQHKVPVGIDGRPQSYESTGILGSLRATAFSPELAAIIWDRLKDAIPLVRVMDEYTPTDHDGKKVWRAVGINPVMRFIVYPEGEGESKLVPHYDSTFDGFSSGTHRTLMSLVLYLDTSAPGSGGGTQFILDPQRHLPVRERRFQDWDVDPSPSEVLVTVPPTQGAALLFDHRLLHAGEKALGGKVIIRTDIIFVECGVLPRGVRCPLIVEGEGPETFGLTLPASAETVDSAYRAALESVTEEHHAQRMELLWKMLRDPFYSLVYATRGWSAAKFAGFFDDHKSLETLDESGDDPAFLVTPLHKILRRLEESKQRRDGATETKPLAVLFTTGAFCPIQAGHLRSMELAREALEERGYEVLGGFFSPDSDHYVLQKVGPFVTDAIQRVRMCQATVKDSDWLDVDPWNALHTDRARNFTDGVERLSAYLSRHVPTGRPIEVYYVFGGDNAPFAYAFAERGHCVCVERSGYEQLWKKVADDPLVKWNRRLLMVHNPEDTPNHSSTAVRSGDYSALGMETRKLWEQERRSLLSAFEVRPARGILHIRHEDDWPIAHWSSYCDPERLAASWGTFTKGVIGAFAAAFERGRWNVAIQMLSLSTQREQARLATQGHDVISLDPCIPGSINLGVSRVYPVGATVSPLDMIPRPGWPSFDEQLAAIQPGEYILFDDDSATGRTLAWVERLLSTKDLTIIREETLTRGRISIEEPERVRDLCDMRDFIAGAREGGLVVKLPDGSVARAPYSLPYVLPAARISLPLGQERWFSRRIWELNLEFFSSLDSTLTVEHAFPAFKTLALYIGFERSTPMADVAEWHVRRLRPRF